MNEGLSPEAESVRSIIKAIGEDPNRSGIEDTPNRVVKSWGTLFGGYNMDAGEILSTRFENESYSQMVVLRDIELYSTCEHHMLPFVGKAHIAYIPNGKVVGLSKLARLVECFARRMQIQERLTDQIASTIEDELKPLGVGVCIEAKHFCMLARGVNKQNSVMQTTSLKGLFKEEQPVREEFLAAIRGSK